MKFILNISEFYRLFHIYILSNNKFKFKCAIQYFSNFFGTRHILKLIFGFESYQMETSYSVPVLSFFAFFFVDKYDFFSFSHKSHIAFACINLFPFKYYFLKIHNSLHISSDKKISFHLLAKLM